MEPVSVVPGVLLDTDTEPIDRRVQVPGDPPFGPGGLLRRVGGRGQDADQRDRADQQENPGRPKRQFQLDTSHAVPSLSASRWSLAK